MNKEMTQWACQTLLSQGYTLKSDLPEEVQCTPWSDVVRFITSEGYIYLKHTPALLALEAGITQVLHDQLPDLYQQLLSEKDDIVIMPHNPKWSNMAQQELAMLKEKLSFPWVVGMQHIGSTAVPDLPAKPIIDIAIGVTDLTAAKALIPILEAEDYVFWAENPDPTKLFFVKGMPPFGKQRTHHIHVMPMTHHDWVVRPLFRDYLMAHPDVKQAYADLKQSLAVQFREDREAYTEAKTEFIRAVNLKAATPYLHFEPLVKSHFPLLLKWLETLHVKQYWDQDIVWTLEKITAKYSQPRSAQGYVIEIGENPLGYIQVYPISTQQVGLDFYVGEPTFLKKGFGTLILEEFLKRYVDPYFETCLVDPDANNLAAIRTYEKVGFRRVQQQSVSEPVMLRKREL